jgi:GR25 family glycosyltransferase involved in LPS biosynthesis
MTASYSISYSFGGQNVTVAEAPTYRGLFINLDRSVDRRVRMEAQLKKLNLQERYSRFSAVDGQTLTGTPGAITANEYACFQSHCLAIESAKDARGTTHILEDDIDVAPELEQVICSLDAKGLLDPFDLVFTDTGVNFEPLLLRRLKQLFDRSWHSQPRKFNVLDFVNAYQCGFTSYLVPAGAAQKVASVLRQAIDAGPQVPIDILVRQEAQGGRLRLGCIFPFITCVQVGEVGQTTITDRGNETEISRAIIALLRYSFFAARDLENLPPSLLERLHAHDNDAHHRLITAVLGFVVSADEFSEF